MLVHVSQAITALSAHSLNIAEYGAKGVQLFFVISGFTLGIAYLNNDLSMISFYTRRFFRIAPMFYAGLIIYTFLAALGSVRFSGTSDDPITILLTLAFMHGWVPEAVNKGVPGGWSIAAEMSFYAIFPALHYFFKNSGAVTYLISIIMALIIGLLSYTILKNFSYSDAVLENNFHFYFWITQLPAFVIGLAASQLRLWLIKPMAVIALYGATALIIYAAISKSVFRISLSPFSFFQYLLLRYQLFVQDLLRERF